jgi:signal transduction histidine kinase
MKRAWHIWAAYAAGLLTLVGGMGWVTGVALSLDRDRLEAQGRAEFEEQVRLALWRLDSRAAVLVARETARPYSAYTAGGPTWPGPRGGGGHVLLYFRVSGQGEVTSPQVPADTLANRTSGMAFGAQQEMVQSTGPSLRSSQRASLLDDLRQSLDRGELVAAIPPEQRDAALLAEAPESAPEWLGPSGKQAFKNEAEFRARAGQNVAQQEASNFQAQAVFVQPVAADARLEPMYPFWHREHLLLARRVATNGSEQFQGCVLDWPAVRGWLLEAVRDLLPAADLAPVSQGEEVEPGRLLASLPLRLLPGRVQSVPVPPWTPIKVALLVGWACILASALSAGLLLAGAVALGERRAAFVSAVTHELRTPLTTFRMYTEMLDEGMVPEEEARREYVGVLHREAERLSHLVENVLAFARLERGRQVAKTEVIRVGDMMDRLASDLGRQVERLGAALICEEPGALADMRVEADPSAVEQIMSNLLDNACKYACEDDPRVHLQATGDGRSILLTVRDHGPGIPRAEARRIFRPFRKSAREAANSAPGVGLGLALSRQLARSMGGDLRLANPGHAGACFVLCLRKAPAFSG